MKKSFRILLTLVLALVMVLSLTACLSDCESGKHAFVDVEAKSATCTQAGNVAYKKCPVCGVCIDADGKQIAEADVVIPATGHVFDQEVATATYLASEATCQEKAVYYKSCVCGAKGTETFESGNLAEHAYTQEVATATYLASEATCTAQATYYYSCACGEKGTKTFESGNLAAHAYTQGVATETYLKTAATCQEKAVYYKSCVCGAKGTETFESGNLAEHAYTQEVATATYLASEATCTAQATYYYSCACGEKGTKTFESGNLAAHAYTQGVATETYLKTAATCQEKAVYYKSCVCGAKGTETFESGNLAEHAYTQGVATATYLATEATCTAKATYYYSCECGAKGTETFESGNLADHAYTQGVATATYLASEATCTAKATYYYSCVCGAKGTETFESGNLAAHTYGDWTEETPATCVAAGTKGYYTCSVCEKNYDKNDNEIDDLTLAIDEDAHDCKYEDTSSTKHTVSCQREGCTYTAAVEHSYTNGVCVCGKTEPKVGWKGVNDVSELKVGDKIIIVGAKGDALYAIGTNQKSNNREAVEITKNGAVITIGDDVQVIVLEEGTKEGTFAFSVGNGYLYAASSTANYMRTETTLSDNSSWTITFANGAATITAQGTNERNLLRFNATDSLFSCYSSGQKDVYIYKYYSACDHEGKDTDTTTVPATCTTDGATVVTCKYCGEAISTTVLPAGHVYGEPVANATDSSVHTYTCTREGCEHSYNEAHAYENHVCTKCNAAEPTYTITVTNTALDGNSATVIVKVGENVISIGADGNYTVYQNSEVTIIITAPEGYMFDVVKMDGTALESFSGSHSFTIAANVAFEVTIKLIPDTHTCDFTKATKLAETDENYATKHQMVCECTKVSETLVDHVFGEPEQIEGNATQHKLVCACGYEKEEAHDFDPDTHECVCGASRLKTIAQALEACDKLANKEYSADIWYVQGYVVGKPSFNSSYNNYTLNIAAELGGTTTLKVYGLMLNDNTTAIYENDLIVVSGYLQKFNSDLEITFQGSTDCLLETYTAGTSNISISAESSANATVTIADGKTSGTNGTSFSFTVVAASGYEVTSVKVNDSVVTAGEDGKYTAKVEGATTILVATKKEGVVEPVTETWTLVTDVTNLAAGDKIIIVYTEGKMAMGEQNNSVRKNVAVTISANSITNLPTDVAQFTLGGDSTSGWTFTDNDGLLGYSGSGNTINTYALSSATNYTWSIDITSGVTKIINKTKTDRVLQYNTSSPRFACYTGTQKNVSIYKKG